MVTGRENTTETNNLQIFTTMETRTQAKQNGKIIFHDVEDFAKQHELSLNKMKCLISEILGIYGYVEFKKVER